MLAGGLHDCAGQLELEYRQRAAVINFTLSFAFRVACDKYNFVADNAAVARCVVE